MPDPNAAPHGQREHGHGCPGCGAPDGYLAAGPCRDHGTRRATAADCDGGFCLNCGTPDADADGGCWRCNEWEPAS